MSAKSTDAKKSAAKAAKKGGKNHLLIIIDESGSMDGREEAVVTGVNEFVTKFKENKATRVSIGCFDYQPGEPRSRFKVTAQPISKVRAFVAADYAPRGLTPLNDAVIDTIELADKHVKKDEGVFIVILTDGLENKSEASAETVAALVKKREKTGWGFLFLGGSLDEKATVTAAKLGLNTKQAFQFTTSPTGTNNAMVSASNMAAGYIGELGDMKHKRSAYASASASVMDSLVDGALPENEVVDIKPKKKTPASKT